MQTKTSKYTVTNVYGITGESTHRTAEAAIRAARKREGDGWIVVDQDGNQWVNINTVGQEIDAVMV